MSDGNTQKKLFIIKWICTEINGFKKLEATIVMDIICVYLKSVPNSEDKVAFNSLNIILTCKGYE